MHWCNFVIFVLFFIFCCNMLWCFAITFVLKSSDVLLYVVLFRIDIWHFVFFCPILCYFMISCISLCYYILFVVCCYIFFRVVLYQDIVLWCFMSFCYILCYFVLIYIMLFFYALFYAILCCVVIRYVVLY